MLNVDKSPKRIRSGIIIDWGEKESSLVYLIIIGAMFRDILKGSSPVCRYAFEYR